MKRVLLAAGIFYPEVGGPAIHTRHIAEEIVKRGGKVRVIAYGGAVPPGTHPLDYPVTCVPHTLPAPLRWALYFALVLWYARHADLVYAFDVSAAGFPAACAATLMRKKFFIRIGGDPIWERVVEQGARFLSLDEYYRGGYYRTDRPILFHLIRFTLRRAQLVITYTEMLVDLYVKYFGVPLEHTRIIRNPIPAVPARARALSLAPLTLYAGRFVAYKNLSLVLRAFVRVRARHPAARLMLVGSGPDFGAVSKLAQSLHPVTAVMVRPAVPHEELRELQQEASLALAPALTEFNPNFALESLALGMPVLISKGNGLTVSLPPECLFDPKNEDELAERWSALLDAAHYQQLAERIVHSIPQHGWAEVRAAHAELIGL